MSNAGERDLGLIEAVNGAMPGSVTLDDGPALRVADAVIREQSARREPELRQLADDLNAEFARRSSGGRLESARLQVPELARIIADNPVPMIEAAALGYVMTSALNNIVKPRGVAGILACAVVANGLGMWLMAELTSRGILKFRVRDQAGCLVPLEVTRDPVPDPA